MVRETIVQAENLRFFSFSKGVYILISPQILGWMALYKHCQTIQDTCSDYALPFNPLYKGRVNVYRDTVECT